MGCYAICRKNHIELYDLVRVSVTNYLFGVSRNHMKSLKDLIKDGKIRDDAWFILGNKNSDVLLIMPYKCHYEIPVILMKTKNKYRCITVDPLDVNTNTTIIIDGTSINVVVDRFHNINVSYQDKKGINWRCEYGYSHFDSEDGE